MRSERRRGRQGRRRGGSPRMDRGGHEPEDALPGGRPRLAAWRESSLESLTRSPSMKFPAPLSRRPFLILLLASLVAPTALLRADEKPAGPKTVRLLTIGNSFSNNATKYLEDLVKADGNVLVRGNLSIGGSPLELHWGKVE